MALSRTLIIILVALSTIFSSTIAEDEEYIVGDYYGWRTFFDYQAWAANKNFYVGDRIVFNYLPGWDNVVKVTPEDFITCTVSPDAITLKSGHDEIRLEDTGARWYISSVSDHCKLGQKLAIYVRPARSPPAPAPAWTPITPSAEPPYYFPPQVGPTPAASAPWSPITPSAESPYAPRKVPAPTTHAPMSPMTPSAEPCYYYIPTGPPAPAPDSQSHSASWTNDFSGRFARSMPKKPFKIFH